MEEKNRLEEEPKPNATGNSSNDSTGETESSKTEGSTPSKTTVDPPPTTSPEGAGEVIKPIGGRERNPKKR
ncbi:hypothetical protein J2X97_000616 [Epilithonimonas hungarica]|uniref:hypothetical protein n=1 Tax=Epilithonimonas hungarica TaxID=454006 RepID=UPI0027812905|nr:hypothetical protein [Epilithonimonas hungarica]MDP9954979.1 hypothetical protein [Epilithonimonas hungarica]